MKVLLQTISFYFTGTKFDSYQSVISYSPPMNYFILLYRYKVCLIASDTTWQLRFMLFQDRAMQLIGKPAEKLLTTYRKSNTPPEISALIGQKFTFIVRVLPEKKLIAHDPTFEVLNIKKTFGKQLHIPNVKIERQPASSTTSTSEKQNLPPPVPICPKQWQNKVYFLMSIYIFSNSIYHSTNTSFFLSL